MNNNSFRRQFVIPFLNVRFRTRPMSLREAVSDALHWIIETLIYAIGPILIVLALGIVSLLTYTFATILIPMLKESYSVRVAVASATTSSRTMLVLPWYGKCLLAMHILYVAFVVSNILYNYFYCVLTKHSGPHYDAVVRELAQATNFVYPETPNQVLAYKREFEDRMTLRIRRRRAREVEARNNTNNNHNNSSRRSSNANHTASSDSANSKAAASQSPSVAIESATSSSATSGVTQRRSNGSVPPLTKANNDSLDANNTTTTAVPMDTDTTSSSATTTSTTHTPPPQQPKIRQWTLLAPFEWAFCIQTHQPKPPRSHYDHVTKCLILNLDHYCPWMFNSIGYFNYRYFVNFLLFCAMGMLYGSLLTLKPFLWLGTPEYRQQWKQNQDFNNNNNNNLHGFISQYRIQPMIPHRQERMLISLAFMLCTAVGLAVLVLGGFHVYLVCTAQTTIEFHANWMARKRAKSMGQKWKNPYSLGNWHRNWQQVYGQDRIWWLSILPSSREPEVLPAPVPGKEWRIRRLQHQQPFIDDAGDHAEDDADHDDYDERTELLDQPAVNGARLVTV